jgi:peptidoglycan/LPS O-acetylase OafA/YrhL
LNKEIPEITGMRGYASVGVIIFHFFTISSVIRNLGFPPFVYAWNSGVDFFFVLSGFLLSIPFVNSSSKVHLKSFYVKRAFRIFPVYYLSILVCGSVLLLSNHGTVQQLIASLFFAQSFSPATFNSINGVNWTLVIEEMFYATLPIFSFFFMKKRWKISLPACLLITMGYRLAVIHFYASDNVAFYLWQYPSYLGHFGIGITLANFYSNKRIRNLFSSKLSSSMLAFLSVISLLVTQFVIGSIYSTDNNKQAMPGIIFAFEYGALIYFVLVSPQTSRIRRIFDNRPAIFAGKISYSSYTWHLPIEIGLYQLGVPLLIWAPIAFVLSLCVASLSFRNLEIPFLKLRNKFLAQRGWGQLTNEIGSTT